MATLDVPEKNIPLKIKEFVSTSSDFDFCAPYQRDFVWNNKLERGLIESIIYGIRINAISVVRKGELGSLDYDKLWVLDGKQRLHSILKFVKDGFTIGFVNDDNSFLEVTYSDLKS
jgi:hypothetical protein